MNIEMVRGSHSYFLILSTLMSLSGCELGIRPVYTAMPAPTCESEPTLFGGGNGTSEDPYKVCSRAHLAAITGSYLSKNFIQLNDIDMGGASNPITPIGTYGGIGLTGTYDGNSFTISGVYYNNAVVNGIGLFGLIGVGGTVKNLILTGVNITANVRVGGVAANVSGGTVQNCRVSGSVTGGRSVGGVIGSADTGALISKVSSSATVSANNNSVGGVLGSIGAGGATVTLSYATGAIVGSPLGNGGLIGRATIAATVSESYATGAVQDSGVGAIATGGLIGDAQNLTLTHCYSTGAVSGGGASIGGLVGRDLGGNTLNDSFWDVTTSGQVASALGAGLTTAQMKDYTNFTNWDFTNVWNGAAYGGSAVVYPFLR